MPFAKNDGARIHWDARGTGTPVLLIMGHLYSSAMWYPLLETLARTHRVITFDNRGTGRSDTTSNVSIAQLAADARAVLDATGEQSAHVYGVSMGGGIAAEFGMTWPERTRSLTLGCTMLKTDRAGHGKGRPGWLYRMPRWLVTMLMRKGAKPEHYGSAAPRDAALHDMGVIANDHFTMKGVREQARAIADYSTTPERARDTLTMPVLVLHGDEDPTVDVAYGRALHATLPGSRYVEFAGAGHNYLVAAGDTATRTFVDFIDEVDAHHGEKAA